MGNGGQFEEFWLWLTVAVEISVRGLRGINFLEVHL